MARITPSIAKDSFSFNAASDNRTTLCAQAFLSRIMAATECNNIKQHRQHGAAHYRETTHWYMINTQWYNIIT